MITIWPQYLDKNLTLKEGRKIAKEYAVADPSLSDIERAAKSGVSYVAQPGGSIRDDNVIDTCNKYGIAMAFTGVRLFHH